MPVGGKGSGRLRFADHAIVLSPLRKLYQPLHHRFYAVVVELFCDEPGLPRAGAVQGVDLSFVIRRERTLVQNTNALRQLARSLTGSLYKSQYHTTTVPAFPDSDDLDDMAFAGQAAQIQLTPAQRALLGQVRPRRVVEAWVTGRAGTGRWQQVDEDAPPALADGELELPMWQLPPREEDCAAARTRSLWFGVLPTHSADMDDLGLPRLDNRAVYRARCLARQHPGPGHEHCPDRFSWSDPTAPYRLAPHADPDGTKNHRVSITMPDLRAVAARAGRPPGPGGVEIVQPPGSQLKMNTSSFPPTQGPDMGAETSRCTFALELFMIVSMFVFSLFLPVVVFVFQLWWLLLLRFCLPSDGNGAPATRGVPQRRRHVRRHARGPEYTFTTSPRRSTRPRSSVRCRCSRTTARRPGIWWRLLTPPGPPSPRRRFPCPSPTTRCAGHEPGPTAGGAVTIADWIGKGSAFPLRPGTLGQLEYVSGDQIIRQSIETILDTEPGERVMLPTFGCGLRRFLMQPNTPATRTAMQQEISDSLRRWEPRIQVSEVSVTPGDDPALVWVSISYTQLADRREDNLVYPFYLR